jgi:hypothetical protein
MLEFGNLDREARLCVRDESTGNATGEDTLVVSPTVESVSVERPEGARVLDGTEDNDPISVTSETGLRAIAGTETTEEVSTEPPKTALLRLRIPAVEPTSTEDPVRVCAR